MANIYIEKYCKVRPEFCYLLIYKPFYCNFLKRRKKILKIFFFFYNWPTLNIICFVEKYNYIFLRFYLCIFESDTVKSDCPVQIFRKIVKYLKI